MRRGHDPYQSRPPPPPSSGFFYSRSGAPSPSHSHRSFAEMPQHRSRRSMEPPVDDVTPSYYVEHLATFAVGRQFGLVFPQDGIRKLRRLEKNSAIYAQPLILRLKPQELTVEDENGELVERFNMELVDSPTPYVSNDHRDMYNNILLFIVKDDPRDRTTGNRVTEMHIFQCNRVAATEVAQDIKSYMDKHYHGVRNGRRSTGPMQTMVPQALTQYPADDASISSDSSELFERDVNTLNRCFDDIERFVARAQSAAMAQRELEQQVQRNRTAQRKDKRPSHPDPNGILQMRAQLPLENEFVDVLRKFKLSFNLLAKLKSHIHEPNAPELLHFLFSPLKIILNACHWGLGRNIAPQVVAPLLSLEARELLQNCLTSQESDLWISLGEAWRTPPEDWPGQLPPPYRPVFMDGFAPYGLPDQMRSANNYPAPLHRGESAPPAQYRQPPPRDRSVDTAPNTPLASRSRQQRPQRNMSVDNLDLDRMSLERERMDFERAKMLERERRLLDEERRLREERARVEAERNLLKHENTATLQHNGKPRNNYEAPPSSQASPAPARAPIPASRPVLPDLDAQSPRQRAFVDDVVNRGGKLVMATFDRVAQNQKELTVSRGEYLEVLEDSKNWWECRNVHQRVGYVPHTILSVVPMQDNRDIYGQPMRQQPPPSHQQLNGHASSSGPISPKATYSDAGVQANVQQVIRAPSPQPQPVAPQPTYHPPQPYQPAPAPAPTRTMIDTLRDQQRRHVSPVPQPEAAREPIAKPTMLVTTRTREEQQVINELSNTVVNKNEFLKPNREIRTSNIQINEGSSTRDVARWLEEKGFSYRVLDLFDGQDGAALFSLNKNHLIQACGRDEGSRLYSQILVQKNRSNYQTRTNAELKAILKMRKTHVEVTNTAPDEEPPMAVA